VQEYLQWAGDVRRRRGPTGKFSLLAVEAPERPRCAHLHIAEGQPFAHPGDRICARARRSFNTLSRDDASRGIRPKGLAHQSTPGERSAHRRRKEIKKLEAPKISLLRRQARQYHGGWQCTEQEDSLIGKITKLLRPSVLMSDGADGHVYGLCRRLRFALGKLPPQPDGVYSYSKYFGVWLCTGWRLGVIVRTETYFRKQEADAKLPSADVKALDKSYGAMTLEPSKAIPDRLVADSRAVASTPQLGLSLHQQVK